MKIVDANVLLYATNETSPQHRSAKRWVEAALIGTEPVGFAWVVVLAFIRLSTNRRVFAEPLTPEQATSTVATWLNQPAAVLVEPTERHVDALASFLRIAGTGGNLVTDAHIAALAFEHQAEVITYDADFRKFAGIRWSSPE